MGTKFFNHETVDLAFSLFISFLGTKGQPSITSPQQVADRISAREASRQDNIFSNYKVRNVGPVVQGGRVSDIAVNPQQTKHFLVAFASGGVFKTENNGITFTPIFDNQGALTIGDIAMAPSDPSVIWVGTGEKNSSRSSYAGSGVYSSKDGGKSWQHHDLAGTQHIGRIVVHPENPDIVWVASMGNLYTHNSERGIYKTTDGGNTWQKTLFVNDSTGVIDLIINPDDPNMLWAATWERTRKAWNFKGHGPGSAIYRSTDGGNTWSQSMLGLKDPGFMGRIGLDISLTQPHVLYALVDNQFEMKEDPKRDGDELITKDFVDMTADAFLALDDKKLDEFLTSHNFPKKYSSKIVKQEIKEGKYKPNALVEFLGDANNALFSTKVKGAEVYKSTDHGDTWTKTHDYELESVYYTYGYYFGEIRISPEDPDEIYVFGVPLIKSEDGGKTFARADTIGDVHSDHQAMWINPEDADHLLLGNDGGLYISYDGGAAWRHINNIPAGQFYTVNVDMAQPYNIYGGLQDNGILRGSSRSIPNVTANWEYLFGGDGMFSVPDPRDHNLVYVGYQFGNYYRIHTEKNTRDYITPSHDIGTENLRFNWRTPVVMSKHNPDILYMGAQKVFRTMDKADQWTEISPDLTKDLPNGNVPYSTITCISESALKFGLLYVGTDDGNVQVSRDGGNTWELIVDGLPENKWVSSLVPSAFKEGRIYVTLTGYREDDFSTYIYRSEDYGRTWTNINGDIRDEAVNVIVEDPAADRLLYLGTDHGTYVSLNGGDEWILLAPIPNVANYDMVVHPRDHELVIGTHGRSIYVLDVLPIRSLVENGSLEGFFVMKPEDIRHSTSWGESRAPFVKPYLPSVTIPMYVNSANLTVKMEVLKDDVKLAEKIFELESAGFYHCTWDVKVNALDKKNKIIADEWLFAEKGKYELIFTSGNQVQKTSIELK